MTGRSAGGDERHAVRLTVVGSVNLDLVARCERQPRPGETLSDASFARHPGGKGANQAVAAARLGAAVTFVGSVGEDAFADEALAGMREAGVDTALERGTATGVALIVVDDEGENTIVAAASQAERFFLNAAPAKAIPPEPVRAAELVVVNRYELNALPEAPRLTALTLGEEGAVLLERGEEIARAAAPKVQAVDGTAAGDAFTACLVVSLLEERDREEALRRACAAGAIAASRPGAQPSLPTAAEVDEMLQA